MRYDTPVYFQTIERGAYNPDTGNYGPDKIKEVKKWASVTDTGAEMLNLVYGRLQQQSKTIRLQNGYEEPFDRIRIGDKVYESNWARGLRIKFTLVVSEIQGGAANAEDNG